MLSHDAVWSALDRLAEINGLTPSGLARKSGLDATSFNKSKRVTASGRLRWPSTESIAKALKATRTDLETFVELVEQPPGATGSKPKEKTSDYRKSHRAVPVIGLAQAGVGGFFDDGGFPAGQGWEEIEFPSLDGENIYALQVTGESMIPVYRDGDVIIVAPHAAVRKGDRVVVKTRDGEVMAKILSRRTAAQIELLSFNPEHPPRILQTRQVEWIARILWASQ